MITDAQIHLWEADRPERPWPVGVRPDIDPPMTVERFVPMMDEIGVDRAVISPPGVCGFSNEYAFECVAKYPRRLAITSRWDLDDGAMRDKLPTWLAQPGMIGIRLALLPNNVARWAADGRLDQFWADCERLDIPLMLFTTGDLEPIEAAAARHPGLALTVDHANLVQSKPETIAERIAALNELAQYPNVTVKLGALPNRSTLAYPYADLHAPLRRIYDVWGSDRLMWASDLTTSMALGKANYRENFDMLRLAAFGFLDDKEMAAVFGGTVSRVFRWAED